MTLTERQLPRRQQAVQPGAIEWPQDGGTSHVKSRRSINDSQHRSSRSRHLTRHTGWNTSLWQRYFTQPPQQWYAYSQHLVVSSSSTVHSL